MRAAAATMLAWVYFSGLSACHTVCVTPYVSRVTPYVSSLNTVSHCMPRVTPYVSSLNNSTDTFSTLVLNLGAALVVISAMLPTYLGSYLTVVPTVK